MALGTTGLVVAAALTAGVAGAGVAALVMETSRPAASATPPESARLAALEDRLARQEEEIQALQGRIETTVAARIQPAPGRSGPGAPVPAAGPDHIPGAGTATPAPDAAALLADTTSYTPADLAQFETLYKAMREKEQEESRRTRLLSAEAQLRERLDRAPDLELTAEQKEAVVKILMGRAEKIRQVYESARAPGTTPGPDNFRAMQEQVAAVRAEARQSLDALLTPEQLKIVDSVDGGNNNRGPGGPAVDSPRRPNGGRRPGTGGTQDPPK